jgi:hypothetical protein
LPLAPNHSKVERKSDDAEVFGSVVQVEADGGIGKHRVDCSILTKLAGLQVQRVPYTHMDDGDQGYV